MIINILVVVVAILYMEPTTLVGRFQRWTRQAWERAEVVYQRCGLAFQRGSEHVQHELSEGALRDKIFDTVCGDKNKRTCSLCCDSLHTYHFVALSCGDHEACKGCLRMYATMQLDLDRVVFACPFSRECPPISDVCRREFLRHDKDIRQRWTKVSIRKGLADLQNAMKCPTPSCTNAVFSEIALDNEAVFRVKWSHRIRSLSLFSSFKVKDNIDMRKFKCEHCGYSYCAVCKRPWTRGNADHSNVPCSKYHRQIGSEPDVEHASEAVLKKQQASGRVVRCPACKMLIEKTGGCNHMTCAHCKHEFCWRCKRDYPMQCSTNCKRAIPGAGGCAVS